METLLLITFFMKYVDVNIPSKIIGNGVCAFLSTLLTFTMFTFTGLWIYGKLPTTGGDNLFLQSWNMWKKIYCITWYVILWHSNVAKMTLISKHYRFLFCFNSVIAHKYLSSIIRFKPIEVKIMYPACDNTLI